MIVNISSVAGFAHQVGGRVHVANAVLFLASDEARYITATHLTVDGGLTAGRAG